MALSNDTEDSFDTGSCKMFGPGQVHGEFGPLFHFGNVLLGIAFLMPQWLTTSQLALRGLVTFAYLFLTIWSAIKTCAAQYFLYNISILVISTIYLVRLSIKHFPVIIPKHLETIYNKIFRPFHISKKVNPYSRYLYCHIYFRLESKDTFSYSNASHLHVRTFVP